MTKKRKKMPRQDFTDPLSPFGGDVFKYEQQPKGGIKKPKKKPAQAPESRALYDLQTDILKALSELEKDEYDGKAMRHLRNSYKIINRYLRQYAHGGEHGKIDGSSL
jgi:hypothetical protein